MEKITVVTEKGVYNFSVFKGEFSSHELVTLVQAFLSAQLKNETAFSLKFNVENKR